MTLSKAQELIRVQADLGGGYNRNAVRLILAEVQREHGQQAVDQLIRHFALDVVFGLHTGTVFTR